MAKIEDWNKVGGSVATVCYAQKLLVVLLEECRGNAVQALMYLWNNAVREILFHQNGGSKTREFCVEDFQ